MNIDKEDVYKVTKTLKNKKVPELEDIISELVKYGPEKRLFRIINIFQRTSF